jgi:hypothetical protein
MQPGEVRLSIDCGSVSAVAVLSWPDGRWAPVLFDGIPQLPAGVYVEQDGTVVVGAAALQRASAAPERFVSAPIGRIREGRVTVGDREIDAVDLVAVVLRRVGERATTLAQQTPGDVRLVVPAGWGPRRRSAMRQAAHRAGLGQPTLIEAPVAAAEYLLARRTQLLVGSYLAVCDLGGGFEASVLRRTPTGFEVLSTLDAAEAGGVQVDEVVADELAGVTADPASHPDTAELTAGERLALMISARTAIEALTDRAAVAVTLPAPRPAVVLNITQLEALARPVLSRAADTIREAIGAAGIRPDELAGTYCVGGAATPLALRILGEATGLGPTVVDQPQLAAVLGAAGAARPAVDEGDLAAAVPAPPLPPMRRAVALLVSGVASLALLIHFLGSAEPSNPYSRGGTNYYVLANWGELAVAATFALVTCLAAATLIASTLPATDRSRSDGGSAQPTQQIGTGLLAATAAGLAVAGLYAIGGSVYFGLPNGPFLRWAILPILPIAAAVTVTAVLATRWGRIPREGWHAWLNFPIGSILCAATGMLLIQASMIAHVYPSGALLNGLVGRCGALLLGVGAALALVRSPRYRIIVAAPLGVFAAAIVSWPATGVLGIIYIAAVSVWWLRQVWRLARAPRRPQPQAAQQPSANDWKSVHRGT